MCSVSFIMDGKIDDWQRRYWQSPAPVVPPCPMPTQLEIEEFRRLLDRAREYDRKMNQPDCELEEKRRKLRDMAKELGVDIAFV